MQGLSIDGPITIFDIDTPYIDPNFVYVAITRARDFKNVYIYKTNETNLIKLIDSKINQYFKDKISGYKQQDKNANRSYNSDDYVDIDFIKKLLIYKNLDHYKNLKHCEMCETPFNIQINNGIVNSNISIDREDNSIGHIKTNCILLCVNCNCSKLNK